MEARSRDCLLELHPHKQANFMWFRIRRRKDGMIVDKNPTATTTVVVGNGVYKTHTEAETAMKTVKVCTTH